MNTTDSGKEKLNMLAAGMITAIAIHVLMCVIALPAVLTAPHDSIAGLAWKAFKLVWNVAGVIGGIFVAIKATGFINGRSLHQTRFAAIGALLLPLAGTPGAVSAFALIPLGALSYYLLKQPEWQALFADYAVVSAVEEAAEEEAEHTPTEELTETR